MDASPKRSTTATPGWILASFFVVAAIVGFAGCRVGPPPAAPCPPALPPTFTARTAESPGGEDLTHWWVEFQDPTLDSLIHQAACRNLELREASFRVMEARAQVTVVRGELFPHAFGTGAYGRKLTSLNANQFLIPPSLADSFDLFSAGFDASWEIDLWGKLRSAVDASEADFARASFSRRDVLVTTLGDVAANYVTARTMQRRLAIAAANLERQRRTREMVLQRQRSGLVGELDVAQATQIVHTTAASMSLLDEQHRVALNRLGVLLGEAPSAEMRSWVGDGPIPRLARPVTVGMPAELLRRRPDIRAAEEAVLAQSNRIGVATADLYPQITLRGVITADSRDLGVWFNPASIAYSVGPQARWDILNFGRLRGKIQVERARFEQTLVRYQQTVLLAVEEVENALAALDAAERRATELEAAVAAAYRAVDLSESDYRRGLIAFQIVLDAQRAALVLDEQLAQSRGEIALASIRIYKALGGGWDAEFDCRGLPFGCETATR